MRKTLHSRKGEIISIAKPNIDFQDTFLSNSYFYVNKNQKAQKKVFQMTVFGTDEKASLVKLGCVTFDMANYFGLMNSQ